MADYSQLFSGAEQKYGLRPGTGSTLSYLESRGNPYATSPKGAKGLLQLMPGTAQEMGVTNPYDPAANADGGLHYFSNILNGPAHGDYRLAAMKYNAGPNRSSYPQSTQSYADQFMARLPQGNTDPSQGPYYPPQSGGQPQMPPQMPQPMSLGGLAAPAPQAQGPSLGAMVNGLPQGNIPKPSKFTAGNVLGVLGDALSAYGGKQPTFGPFLREQQMMDKQQGFEREKFQQELAMRMYAMTHPEEMLKAEAFSTAPQEVRQSMVDYENTLHPTVAGVQQPNGSVINQVIPRQLNYRPGDVHPGTDGNYRFKGGDPTSQASWEKVQ